MVRAHPQVMAARYVPKPVPCSSQGVALENRAAVLPPVQGSVCACERSVGLTVFAGPFISFGGGDGFAGEIPAWSVAHDGMFFPMDSGGAGDIVLAYRRKELTLAVLARRVLTGLSRVMWCFVGLPVPEGDIKDGERPLIGITPSGVASRSRRLMSYARSSIAASRSEIVAFSVKENTKLNMS